MRFETFDSLTFFGRRYYFRGVADGNSEILFPSQAYKSERARDRAIRQIKREAATAPIVESTR